MIICTECGKEYSKMGIKSHIWRAHGSGKNHVAGKTGNGGYPAWNKGLTNETDPRVAAISKKVSKTLKERYPNGTQEFIPDEVRLKISEGMKKAHKEGRAHNIGKSRWNNEQSYPEQFFSRVIQNEFIDKDFVTEYAMGIYSLDFAWPHKKLCIEIDGEQHQRFDDVKERDKRKDLLIEREGWKVLRIVWKDMFKDTKTYISMAKQFIDG